MKKAKEEDGGKGFVTCLIQCKYAAILHNPMSIAHDGLNIFRTHTIYKAGNAA